ncbi:hypothetical protein [Roseateles aquatilis]|uniref:hypothetical protein n=1 Tax=Roseateles aquatilis TaxID=431061 RepID=UPI001EDD4530|nr:hypothetical protein [Roseateles aquatilis]
MTQIFKLIRVASTQRNQDFYGVLAGQARMDLLQYTTASLQELGLRAINRIPQPH